MSVQNCFSEKSKNISGRSFPRSFLAIMIRFFEGKQLYLPHNIKEMFISGYTSKKY